MWNKIKSILGCVSVLPPAPYCEMFLIPAPPFGNLKPSFWLIGQYKHQTDFATNLRNSEALQEFVTQNRVRFGLRETDRPPMNVPRQERYGATKTGKDSGIDFKSERLQPLAIPTRPETPPDNRRGDREENVRMFWATQTPQSHHIVEFNHLHALKVSEETGSRDLDHGQLPCVLLAPEFHQRYISFILKQTHRWSEAQLRKDLATVYHSLYIGRGPLFRPLWEVSKIILGAAGIATP